MGAETAIATLGLAGRRRRGPRGPGWKKCGGLSVLIDTVGQPFEKERE
jgi:hypothetical protein